MIIDCMYKLYNSIFVLFNIAFCNIRSRVSTVVSVLSLMFLKMIMKLND